MRVFLTPWVEVDIRALGSLSTALPCCVPKRTLVTRCSSTSSWMPGRLGAPPETSAAYAVAQLETATVGSTGLEMVVMVGSEVASRRHRAGYSTALTRDKPQRRKSRKREEDGEKTLGQAEREGEWAQQLRDATLPPCSPSFGTDANSQLDAAVRLPLRKCGAAPEGNGRRVRMRGTDEQTPSSAPQHRDGSDATPSSPLKIIGRGCCTHCAASRRRLASGSLMSGGQLGCARILCAFCSRRPVLVSSRHLYLGKRRNRQMCRVSTVFPIKSQYLPCTQE